MRRDGTDSAKGRTKFKCPKISFAGGNITCTCEKPCSDAKYGREASSYATQILLYHSVCVMTIWPLSFSLPNTLRAAADVRFTMFLSIFSMWVFRFGFSMLLGTVLHMGVFGVWVAMTIDWAFRAVCFAMWYRGGKWERAMFS